MQTIEMGEPFVASVSLHRTQCKPLQSFPERSSSKYHDEHRVAPIRLHVSFGSRGDVPVPPKDFLIRYLFSIH